MFSKILTFGIGALALVQGALAIAEGRYIITNPEMGTLVSFHKGDPILLSRAVAPPLGEVSSQALYTTPLPKLSPVDRETIW
jgi:hypothetical protein